MRERKTDGRYVRGLLSEKLLETHTLSAVVSVHCIMRYDVKCELPAVVLQCKVSGKRGVM